MTSEELEQEGILFLVAGKRYYDAMQKARLGGAVVWIKDTDGFGCVFTRGEYTERLMLNIERLGPTHHFGAMRDDL